MVKKERQPIPSPEEHPEAYKNPNILENLYVERGWRRKDIAQHFGITDHEVVKHLQKYDIERDTKYSQAPTNGLAQQLWKKGKMEAVK